MCGGTTDNYLRDWDAPFARAVFPAVRVSRFLYKNRGMPKPWSKFLVSPARRAGETKNLQCGYSSKFGFSCNKGSNVL